MTRSGLSTSASALALLTAAALVGLPAAPALASVQPTPQTVTLSSPGTFTYVVLPAITSVTVHAAGGSGGDGQNGTWAFGGAGGETTSTITVVPGQVLQINVGGGGIQATFNNEGCNLAAGGYNGGGGASYTNGTGGGASDVRSGGYGLADRLVVAGGGGGAGVDGGNGGQGGNPATGGAQPFAQQYGTYAGGPGTQSAGGAGGSGEYGTPTAGVAGSGGQPGCNNQYSTGAGGGGGGWYGGGGGGAGYGESAGGGGGSSYGPAGSTFSTGTHSGNGFVTLTFTAPAVGPATTLTVSPSTATTSAGQSQTYAVEAFDVYGDDLGDVTSSATFTVAGGSCTGSACAATPAGAHTVTATYHGVSGTATQTVRAATSLVLSGFPASTAPGVAHTLTVNAVDSAGAAAANDNDALTVTSTDGNAALPSSNPVLVAGQVQFPVTLNNAGSQTVTVTDTTLGISATLPAVAVSGAVSFSVSGYPATSVAGDSATLTVTALDSGGTVVPDYAGTVHFTSSDPAAALPADATLTNGIGHFSAGLRTTGTQSLTATGVRDSALTGGETGLTVNPGSLTQLLASVSGGVTAGAGTAVTVQGGDAYGNIAPWTGTAHFTSSDSAATLPADAAAVNNVATGSVVLRTAGSQSIAVSDTTNAALTASLPLAVSPGAAQSVTLSPQTAVVAGVQTGVDFVVKDGYGNVVPSVYISGQNPYNSVAFHPDLTLGVVINSTWSSTDAAMTFQDSPNPFVAPSVTFHRAGAQQVTFTGRLCYSFNDCLNGRYGGGYISGMSSVTVAPAAASSLSVSLTVSATAGTPQTMTVTAHDPYGNVAALGAPLTIASSDPIAGLPTGAALSNGSWSGSVTLKTAGSQTVIITDSANTSLSTSATATVSPAALASFGVTGYPAGTQAGDAIHTVQVIGEDAYGNRAAGFSGTLTVTSSDPQAVLPGPVAASAGSAAVPVELRSAGTQTITVTDPVSGLTGTESVTVAPAGLSRLVVTAASTPAVAGSADMVTVRALDPYGNLLDADTDTLAVTATDPAGSVPSSVDLAGGVATFSVTAHAAGTQTITVTDASITGVTALPVVAGAAVSLSLTGLPSHAGAGEALPVTVTALDAQGNVATDSTATVELASTDSHPHLPSPTALTDGVAHLALSLDTAGSTTVTASAEHLTSSTDTVSVAAGPASRLGVTTSATPNHDVATAVAVRAFDQFGNTADGDTSTVRFSSTDAAATLPAAAPLAGGALSAAVTWRTGGRQTLTATESGVSGTADDITVSGAAPSAGAAALPGAPTIQGVTTGKGRVTVHFAGHADGGAPITSYTVTSSPDRAHPHGFKAAGAHSPITVTGLRPGDYYTFTVTATSSAGTGRASTSSKAVNPSSGPSPITLHYSHLGGVKSALGRPVGPERTHAGGSERSYQHGTIYYSFGTGARTVLGPIAVRYRHLGGVTSRLGYPLRDDHAVPGGRQVDFQHGSIRYVSKTRALVVTYR